MPSRGKRYAKAAEKIDRETLYGVVEAVELIKGSANAKFDETIELAVRLGVDPRKADQIVRGTLSLPSGTGRSERVAVFAAGEHAQEARSAGADIVGADDLVAKVNEGFLDFDVAIATPDLMGLVGTLGRVLGPRGLMPNPKTGTVTTDVAKAVVEFKGGRVEYRTDKVGNVHVRVGKASFSQAQLLANVKAVIDELARAKPASSKGRYFMAVAISSTMGPSVHIDPQAAREIDEEMLKAVGSQSDTESTEAELLVTA
jgi:large subunit ribosomal protein L1